MNLLQILSEAAPEAKVRYWGQPFRTNPYEDLFWGLLGLTVALVLVRTVMKLRRHLPGADGPNNSAAPDPGAEALLALKLAQWRSSMLILLTASALGICVCWFLRVGNMRSVTTVADLALEMSPSLDLFRFGFAPVLVWHLADLMQRPRSKPRWLSAITGHALYSGIMVMVGTAWVLVTTGWFTVERPCVGIFVLLTESCFGLMTVMGLPIRLLLIALWLLAVVKLAVALRSRLGPRR